MRHAIAIALLASGCKTLLGIEDPELAPIDAPLADIAEPDVTDAAFCYGTVETFCFDTAPTGELAFDASTVLDTSSDPRCTTFAPAGMAPRCVVAASKISVGRDGQLRAIGGRPLVLLATQLIQIDGIVDVSSKKVGPNGAAANAATCANVDGVNDKTGGAGGSFHTKGGKGGGDLGPAAAAASADMFLRGGCPGGNGDGLGGEPGASGGAVMLVANTVALAGTINASGAGGRGGGLLIATGSDGGGGGGSGGAIIVDAQTFLSIGAMLALGGGGGEGSANSALGADGAECNTDMPNQQPRGGASPAGSDGGDGALDGSGGNGTNNAGGGFGGGGGGGGLVRIVSPNQMVGTTHPPATN